MILCDLCGTNKRCLSKEIDGKEYDICPECWRPFAEMLKGKGRTPKRDEIVLLPSPGASRETDDPAPPTIWGTRSSAS